MLNCKAPLDNHVLALIDAPLCLEELFRKNYTIRSLSTKNWIRKWLAKMLNCKALDNHVLALIDAPLCLEELFRKNYTIRSLSTK